MDKEKKDIVKLIAGIQIESLNSIKEDVKNGNDIAQDLIKKLLQIEDDEIIRDVTISPSSPPITTCSPLTSLMNTIQKSFVKPCMKRMRLVRLRAVFRLSLIHI